MAVPEDDTSKSIFTTTYDEPTRKRMKKQMKENLIKNTKNIYLLCDHDFEDFDENTIICG